MGKTNITLNRDTWLHGDGTKILNQYVTGYTENVAENVDLITLSIGVKNLTPADVYYASLWAITAKDYAPYTSKEFDLKNIDSELVQATNIIWDESGFSDPRELIEVKQK